jgi:DnaK suppressor protein
MDINKFTALVAARKREINHIMEAGSGTRSAVELDQSRVGRLARMDAIQMQQMNLESERRWIRELAALDAVLERIECGKFGICNRCGDEIDPRRLEIDVCATLCIGCANIEEKGTL